MRLIDADALKERILKERDKIPLTVPAAPYELVPEKANTHGNAMRGGIRVALRCMEHTPTIDAEPVRHGRWVYDNEGHTCCSECRERLPYIHCYSEEPCSEYDEEWDEEMPESLYCSHCGAKMDVTDNNVGHKDGGVSDG